MSQRIGYSFPLAMLMAGLLFQPVDSDDTQCHASWLKEQLSIGGAGRRDVPNSSIPATARRRYILPLLWLVVQWALPLRMPLVSGLNFKHTMEGYRWSWTMMLHSKKNFVQPGMMFMAMRPRCGGDLLPNPLAVQDHFADAHGFPYERQLGEATARGLIVAQMFPRQAPKIARHIYSLVEPMCKGGLAVSITTSYFSSTNEGPFHRIIDPSVDLASVYDAYQNSSWTKKLWLSLVDKAPRGHEFLLSGIGGITIPPDKKEAATALGWVTFVDRAACLKVDPIRIHNTNFEIVVIQSKYPVQMTACQDLNLQQCKEVTLNEGTPLSVPAIRTLSIGVFDAWNSKDKCSETTEDDTIIMINLNTKNLNKKG